MTSNHDKLVVPQAAKKYGELWWTMDASRVPDHVAEDMVVVRL